MSVQEQHVVAARLKALEFFGFQSLLNQRALLHHRHVTIIPYPKPPADEEETPHYRKH